MELLGFFYTSTQEKLFIDKQQTGNFFHKPQSMTSKWSWSCTGWRIFFKVQVGCNGLSLQGNFRAVEAT